MNKIQNFNSHGQIKMENRNCSFEINPLDINLANIHMNLVNRCEREVPENGDFAPIIEKFKSLDPTRDLSEIKVICNFNKKNPGAKNTNRLLSAQIEKKDGSKKEIELFKGTKKELLEYLKTTEIFKTCKENCLDD